MARIAERLSIHYNEPPGWVLGSLARGHGMGMGQGQYERDLRRIFNELCRSFTLDRVSQSRVSIYAS